jgi:hypothetical protein
MRCDTLPVDVSTIPAGIKRADYRFGEICYDYMQKMTDLCAENGVELLLIKAPVYWPPWFPEWDTQMIDFAAANGLTYINLLNHMDELAIDFNTDTYDAGLHLNLYGAEKLSRYLGKVITELYKLTDRRNEPDTAARWAVKSVEYAKLRETQENELRNYGEIKTYRP